MTTELKSRLLVALWVLAGELMGMAMACAGVWPDFSRRVYWAWNGGGGESADWGEPLFYMMVMGIPAGLLGGVVAYLIVLAFRRRTRSKSSDPPSL
jgi:hypothetical protein